MNMSKKPRNIVRAFVITSSRASPARVSSGICNLLFVTVS